MFARPAVAPHIVPKSGCDSPPLFQKGLFGCASSRTVLTEVFTALGITGQPIDIECLPAELMNVGTELWEDASQRRNDPMLGPLAQTAWNRGSEFRRAREGLRGRPPLAVEWKGYQKPPGYEYIPADIRVDHVFLISCKFGSHILLNTSPAHLFDRLLEGRHGHRASDWFEEVAPDAYRSLYQSIVADKRCNRLPAHPHMMNQSERKQLAGMLNKEPGILLSGGYSQFCAAISAATAATWTAKLKGKLTREIMAWRLLRLADAPYFLLGTDRHGLPIRVMVTTPWDWRHNFELKEFLVSPGKSGQPLVNWLIVAKERSSNLEKAVEGHVEVRWSHGKFNGFPEAKIYLDTRHEDVPGYLSLRIDA
ncbi:MAG: hypothetical protein HYX94_10300 [Chloroflexi bacterium]|nr:hypothetical protein [Chloroflexota bacterium]